MPQPKKPKRDKSGQFSKKTDEKNWNGYDYSNIWTPLGQPGAGGYDVYGARPAPSTAELLAAYQDITYACVHLIAQAVSKVDYTLCATTSRGEMRPKCMVRPMDYAARRRIEKRAPRWSRKALDVAEVTDHPLLDLLDRPNSEQSWQRLIYGTQTYMDLCGSAFWYLAKDGAESVREIWLLPSQNITIQTDDGGRVTHYTNTAGEQSQDIAPADIIHIRFADPLNPYSGFGVSPLRAVWQRVQLLRKEEASWDAVLTNMAFPSALIRPPTGDTFTTDQATRLARQVTERFRTGEQGGVWVVQDPFDYQPVSTPPKDLAALQLYDQIKSIVCNVFGVPRPMLDMQDANYASSDTARRSFQEFCVEPRVTNILEAINHRLCPPRLFLAAEDIVQEDRAYELQRRAMVLQEYTTGVRNKNEARAELGLAPTAGGDRYAEPVQQAPQFATAQQLPGKSLKVKAYQSSPTDPGLLADALAKLFEKLGVEVIGQFTKSFDSIQTKAFFKVEDWTDAMRRELTPIMRAYYDQGADAVLASLGGDDQMRRLAVQQLDAAVNDAVLALAESTLSTTDLEVGRAVADLREAIRGGLSAGEANAQLADRVKEIFTDLTTRRCVLISETEASRAKHGGELIGIEAAGVDAKKEWLCDAMACDVCKKLNGQVRELDEPFHVDPEGGPYAVCMHPPIHPGDRCQLLYRFPEG